MSGAQQDPAPFDLGRFLTETRFSGYQQITLPDGRIIPGTDRAPVADLVYPADLSGKSVLDVGCYYGFFLHEAIRRGASRAVGIEADPERFRIASALAGLWDGKIDIYQGHVEDVGLAERFDLVLFLRVLHHVRDPLPVMRKLTGLCRGTLIVEFRQPHDPQFLLESRHPEQEVAVSSPTRLRRGSRRLRVAIQSRLLERITRHLPLIGVGSVEYHRSYYFTRAGFRNMFQVHNRLFKAVEFGPSVTRGQALARCDCSE